MTDARKLLLGQRLKPILLFLREQLFVAFHAMPHGMTVCQCAAQPTSGDVGLLTLHGGLFHDLLRLLLCAHEKDLSTGHDGVVDEFSGMAEHCQRF